MKGVSASEVLQAFAVLGGGFLVLHAGVYVHQLLQYGGVVGRQLLCPFQMVEGGLVVGFGNVGVGQGREERGFGGEELCGAVGDAAYLWHRVGGGSRRGGSSGFAGAVVGGLAGVEEGVEVVLHPFDDKDAPALVEIGELPAVACALRAVEGEQYLVAKGLPAHDLAEEIDFAKP